MAILNIGSINIDTVYDVPAIPQPGETVAAISNSSGLGGKGLNQSVAIARAGGKVFHVGAVGHDDGWIRGAMSDMRVDCTFVVERNECPTGSAVVMLAQDGENSIILHGGANQTIQRSEIAAAIASMKPDDWVLVQNETNALEIAVDLARQAGLKIAFAAAPFSADAVLPVLLDIDLIAVNEIESKQLQAAIGAGQSGRRPKAMLVTKGSRGAEYRTGENIIHVDAFAADVVDTTGAGDTFLGYFLAGIDSGVALETAMKHAAAAAALQVSRRGAAPAIPEFREVLSFLSRAPRHTQETAV